MSLADASRIACKRCRRKASRAAISSAKLLLGARRRWDQQPRFEIGEPRRHHQIIGGHFELQLSRLLDEDQILLGQRQDGNPRQINLVMAREFEQQVERTFEAADIDDQRIGRSVGLAATGWPPSGHSSRCCSTSLNSNSLEDWNTKTRAPIRLDQLNLSPVSSGNEGIEILERRLSSKRLRLAGRLEGGPGAAQGLALEIPARLATSAHLEHLAIAMEKHVAAGLKRPSAFLRKAARKRLHREIIGHQKAAETDLLTDHLLMIFARKVAGLSLSRAV